MNTTEEHDPSSQLQPPRQFTPPQFGEVISCNNVNYHVGKLIGNGAFGAVYECMDDWGNLLAAKVLLPQDKPYEQVREEWLHECNNLMQLRHPNITYIHQAFEYRDTFYLIVERCDLTLDTLMTASNIQGDLWLPYVARDLLHGLDYIHNHGYVHKDLHPGNVYISKHYDLMVPSKEPTWSFKIGDLGISRLEGEIRFFHTILARWMLPPEFLNPDEFGVLGKHIDIYHIGLLLLGLLLNRIPEFTHEEILAGRPREMAEQLPSPYAPVIAKALRRHVVARTQTVIAMWREILQVMPRIASGGGNP